MIPDHILNEARAIREIAMAGNAGSVGIFRRECDGRVIRAFFDNANLSCDPVWVEITKTVNGIQVTEKHQNNL